jgi:hypothetical protein
MRTLASAAGIGGSLLFLTAAGIGAAAAQVSGPGGTPPSPNVLPQHSRICAGQRVHKAFLIGDIQTKINNDKNADAQVLVAANPDLQLKLFTARDTAFCDEATKPVCSTPDPTGKACSSAKDACLRYKSDAVINAQAFFRNLNREIQRPNPTYKESPGLLGLQPFEQVNVYFRNLDDASTPIVCSASPVRPALPTPAKDSSALANFRVRGVSDDLYVDRTLPLFKSTSQATGSVNGTGGVTPSTAAKFKGAFGYELDVGEVGQFIPYLSLSQSVTDASGKPKVIDPTNFVASGFLATTFFDIPGIADVQHVVTVKPQYLLNTANESRVASVRFIYAPWTTLPNVPINLNTFQMISFLPGPTWSALLFDFRNDAGTYTNRGNTPAIIATNSDFERAGFRVGLALTTDPSFPSLTLVVAETVLHGFGGFYSNVNNFQASLTYNIESNNYFGITAAYQNGRDEDTAVAAQTWTLGFSTRY